MKEITRRLYTKPVMLGMAFIAGIALVAALFVTTKSTAAPNSFPVAAGNDEFETPGTGESFHDFAGTPIPAGFFGSGSLAFSGLVPLVGVPLSSGSNVDTIIQRHHAVSAPGGTTALTMTGLSLRSINPISVAYSNQTTELWNVKVGLSVYKASTGSMKIHETTFDSTLKVWPKFTFTRVSDGAVKEFDTGASTGPGLTAADQATVSEDFETEPAPAPTVAPCSIATIDETEVSRDTSSATATSSSCPPITLTATSPWGPCAPNTFCITVPITEEERWARHKAGPKGTIKAAGTVVASGE